MTILDRRSLLKTVAVATGSLAAGNAFACGYGKTAKSERLAPRWKVLTEWVREDFEGLVGTPFDIAGRMLVLEEVRKEPETLAQTRDKFALVFGSGKVDDLESATMKVRHPAIGEADLFVNIVRDVRTGSKAEIYFT